MSLRTLLSASSRRPVHGRPLRRRRPLSTARLRTRRDATKHTSDTVWNLVEKMMNGDAEAAAILNDVIEEGVSSGKTKFVKITRRGGQRFGRKYEPEVVPNNYAAITPGRQITLFGTEKRYPGGGMTPAMVPYVRRFQIGDVAEYDSYNLSYLGRISGITDKRVTIKKPDYKGDAKASLDIAQFNSRNKNLNVAETVRRNQEWTD